MHGLRRRKSIKLLGLVILVIIIDQLSKFFVINGLPAQAGGFLQKTCNKNIAWGIPLEEILFQLSWIMAFLVILFLAYRKKWDVFLLMVIAGAISNAIDRFRFGCVVDFISIGTFPVFNLADAFITLGIILFTYTTLKPIKKK